MLLERSCGAENVAPPLVERLKKMSRFPGLSSSHTTLILPLLSTPICELNESPVLLERFCGAENVTPPLVERLNRMSSWPGVLSVQTTLMLPPLSSAIAGLNELPTLLERFCGAENVAPPSVERLKKISNALGLPSFQTT